MKLIGIVLFSLVWTSFFIKAEIQNLNSKDLRVSMNEFCHGKSNADFCSTTHIDMVYKIWKLREKVLLEVQKEKAKQEEFFKSVSKNQRFKFLCDFYSNRIFKRSAFFRKYKLQKFTTND
jgi:hypothetical protein